MNYSVLEKQQRRVEEMIEKLYPKNDSNCEPIMDGIVDEKKYLNAKYRILWILKEPYDEDDGTGGGWSIAKDLLAGKELYKNVVKSSPTFQPMVYVTYSILNNSLLWKDMDYIRDDPDMAQSLNCIAYININKMPALHRSNDADIAEKYEHWKPVLLRQIHRYDPDIVIFGNTFMHFFRDLDIDEDEIINTNCTDYCIIGKKLLISAYHPAQTTVSRQEYIDGIIKIVKEWESNTTKHS